jgi:hypothetical protein
MKPGKLLLGNLVMRLRILNRQYNFSLDGLKEKFSSKVGEDSSQFNDYFITYK